jgi:hypothetical protein
MTNVAITLEHPQGRIDLALPMDVPCHQLADGAARALRLPGSAFSFGLKTEQSMRRLPANVCLGEAGVLNGMVLVLIEDGPRGPVPSGGASLRFEDGEVLQLGTTALIGRRDVKRGNSVDVDLSSRDGGKIISRRHAEIGFKDGYFLHDLGSVNGTWLNGQRLIPNQQYALSDGDEIVFGRKGIRVVFKK